jgi:hypothetical protein
MTAMYPLQVPADFFGLVKQMMMLAAQSKPPCTLT